MVKVERNVNLAKYTTLGVGGEAEYFARASKSEDLLELLNWAYSKKFPITMIGGGSNILISDQGVPGLTILNKARGSAIIHDNLIVETGAVLSAIARMTIDEDLRGLEWASGIPGTIGGAIVGNAGALGGQIADVLVSAEVWHEGSLSTWHNADFDFGYRKSKLKDSAGYHVITAEFHLQKLDHKVLHSEPGFHASGDALEKVHADSARRQASYKGKTAGSYFKNPEGFTAAELIDRAGLKGYRIGGAEVSNDHANVFRNAEKATANDVIALEEHVVNVVKDKFGVNLVPEVVKIGKF